MDNVKRIKGAFFFRQLNLKMNFVPSSPLMQRKCVYMETIAKDSSYKDDALALLKSEEGQPTEKPSLDPLQLDASYKKLPSLKKEKREIPRPLQKMKVAARRDNTSSLPPNSIRGAHTSIDHTRKNSTSASRKNDHEIKVAKKPKLPPATVVSLEEPKKDKKLPPTNWQPPERPPRKNAKGSTKRNRSSRVSYGSKRRVKKKVRNEDLEYNLTSGNNSRISFKNDEFEPPSSFEKPKAIAVDQIIAR